jgi:hypothetical protein
MLRHFPGAPSFVAAFAPTDVSNLSAWFKADSLALSDGASVATWSDSSGNNNTATSALTAAVYKTNIVNGKPIVRFAGDSAYVLSTTLTPTSVTAFVVYRRTGVTQSTCFLSTVNGSTGATGWALGIADGTANIPKWYVVAATQEGTECPLNTAQIITASSSAGTGVLYQGGTEVATGSAQNPIQYDVQTTIGALTVNEGPVAQLMSGDLAEVIVYGKLLTTTERGQVNDYLTSKYAIA